MDNPAIARLSAFAVILYNFSTNGITSSTTSCGNAGAPAATGAAGDGSSVVEVPGRPYGITTIIGLALPSAIKLSRMMFARPAVNQLDSLPPAPCIRYIAG